MISGPLKNVSDKLERLGFTVSVNDVDLEKCRAVTATVYVGDNKIFAAGAVSPYHSKESGHDEAAAKLEIFYEGISVGWERAAVEHRKELRRVILGYSPKVIHEFTHSAFEPEREREVSWVGI